MSKWCPDGSGGAAYRASSESSQLHTNYILNAWPSEPGLERRRFSASHAKSEISDGQQRCERASIRSRRVVYFEQYRNGRPQVLHDAQLEIEQSQFLRFNHQGSNVDGDIGTRVRLRERRREYDGCQSRLQATVEISLDQCGWLEAHQIDQNGNVANICDD